MPEDDNANIISFPANRSNAAGEFFVVDRRSFSVACGLGLNPAVAYLTIARGAGSRSKSAWSVDAIERHTGISRPKAKLAIQALIDSGLITLERHGTRPLYGIVPAHELAGMTLSAEDRIVLGLLAGGGIFKIPKAHRDTAKDLTDRGILIPHGGDYYTKKSESFTDFAAEPEHVWLPNAVVEGAADEVPPLALLRQMQDVRRLRLFVALYDSSDLPNDGGVSRFSLRQNHTLTKVSERGASTIWGFGSGTSTTSSGELHKPFLTGKLNEERKDLGLTDFWASLSALEDCGLLEFIPHVFESEKPEAEMLHAYPVKDGACEPWERSVALAAHAAGVVCIAVGQKEWAVQQARHLLPVPSHIANLAVIGIARLRYRPQTRMTAAWFARSKASSEAWLPIYEKIARENGALDKSTA
jgi:hypothetical protein